MKNLILVRHAKSDWSIPGRDDFDRTLNERGKKDAPNIGLALRQRGIVPDAILTSSAERAESTARLIAIALNFPLDDIQATRQLYLASPSTIVRTAQQLDENWETVLLFGHNPGMHKATNLLSRDQKVADFPTCSVARLELNVNFWGETGPGCGFLVEHLYPKMLLD